MSIIKNIVLYMGINQKFDKKIAIALRPEKEEEDVVVD